MENTHNCNDDRPCPVPAHPDLLARLRGGEGDRLSGPQDTPLFGGSVIPDSDIPGLNDGIIYPPNHSAPDGSQSGMRNSKDRPLRGALKYVGLEKAKKASADTIL
jgi:hypothetical protein